MESPLEGVMCMNTVCRVTMTYTWIKGWALKSGGYAKLCYTCGTTYQNSVFCETYHYQEEGWRKCNTCNKRIHCGCIASKHMHEYMDYGGVCCKYCESRLTQQQDLVPYVGTGHASEKIDNTALDKGKMINSQDLDHCSTMRQATREGNASSLKASDAEQSSTNACLKTQKPPGQLSTSTQIRTQLLDKNLPKISDEELQELFGALNTRVTPLFEKVLSVSDAGKTGRLILPKVCAEAYLPSLSESAGVPLQVLDANGKEWTFQLRFWINNNSRMYVFEGAQRYMREKGLQVGDIVIFGRVPDNKLVLGFKKKAGACITKDNQKPRIEVTYRQAQNLLQPNLNAKCNIVAIEDHEFEEFDEPPVFGYGAECSTQLPGSLQSPPVEIVPNELQSPRSPDPKILFSHWKP